MGRVISLTPLDRSPRRQLEGSGEGGVTPLDIRHRKIPDCNPSSDRKQSMSSTTGW